MLRKLWNRLMFGPPFVDVPVEIPPAMRPGDADIIKQCVEHCDECPLADRPSCPQTALREFRETVRQATRIEVHDGDVIVLTTTSLIDDRGWANLGESLRAALGDVKLMVLEDGMKISHVMSRSDAAELPENR